MPVNRIRTVLVDGWQRLERVLLPPRCVLCQAPGRLGDLCADCAREWPRNDSYCAHCAIPLAEPVTLCGECLRQAPPWDRAWAPFRYAWPLDRLVTRFKFHGDLAAGRVLAEAWLREPRPLDLPQRLLPVPLHRSRLRRRGYNQALELARPLSRALGIELVPRGLRRMRATPPQSKLDGKARRANVRGAFRLQPGLDLPEHVAIVDDVMTTGSTLAECARLLKRAGVQRVEVWALARAPHH